MKALRLFAPPMLITVFEWIFTANKVNVAQAVLSCILLWIPWFTYCRWKDHGEYLLPLFSLMAAAQWASFGLLVFWGPPPADPNFRIPFSPATITSVLQIAVIGVIGLWAGMRVRIRPIRASFLPDLAPTVSARRYVYAILGLGMLSNLAGVQIDSLGSGARQWLATIQIVVPIAVFALLLRRHMQGKSDRFDRIVLFGYISIRVVLGLASGWAGSVISTVLIYCLVHLCERRRLPTKLLLFAVPVFLFLQAGKSAFREAYWYGGHTGSTMQRVEFWVETSWDVWKGALLNRRRDAKSLVTESLGRVSLLDQAGNVYDKTPHDVPYQYGHTYSYFAVTFVPRFLWPNKPSVNDANRFYQVAYGLTTEENLDNVSIAVGCIVEAFINFGWWGVGAVMFVIGLLLGLFERTLMARDSGSLFSAIAIALVLSLVAVESQAAQYIGGLIQQMLLTAAVFAPVIRRRVTRTVTGFAGVPAPA